MSDQILTIHPDNMSEDEKKIFLNYLNSHPHTDFLFENTPYCVTQPNGSQFQLSKNLLLTKEKNNRYHYQMFSFKNQIGSGSYGMVFQSDKEMITDKEGDIHYAESNDAIKLQRSKTIDYPYPPSVKVNDFSSFKEDKHFLTSLNKALAKEKKEKEFANKKALPYFRFQNEIEFGKQAGIKIKSPLIVKMNDNLVCTFTPIQFYEGEELFDVIVKDEKVPLLTTNLRIELAIELLKAFRAQVVQKGLIHCDIKPENIIVDIDYVNKTVRSVRFIDYSFSKKKDTESYESLGTPYYMSPEAFNGFNLDISADIYALSKVIALIFKAEPDNFENLQEAYQNSLHGQFKNLFTNIDDLDNREKKKISILLRRMKDPKALLRPAIDDLIGRFEKIEVERKMKGVSSEEKEQWLMAKENGKKLHQILSKLSNQKKVEYPIQFIHLLQAIFFQFFENVPDNPEMIKLFIRHLGAYTLIENDNKESIKKVMNDLFSSLCEEVNRIDSFMKNQKKYQGLFPKNEQTSISQYQSEITRLLTKLQNKPHNVQIDHLFALNTKLKKINNKLNLMEEKLNKKGVKHFSQFPTLKTYSALVKKGSSCIIQAGFFAQRERQASSSFEVPPRLIPLQRR